MRCKKHGTDLSSTSGVCASCLRERLNRVIIAQEQLQSQSEQLNHCNSNSNTNPTVQRPVSPYLTRRKSINSVNPVTTVQRPYNKPRLNHSISDKRFYNSPQIAFNTGVGCIGSSSSNAKKPMIIRFPSISNLFRSNSRNGDADSNPRVSASSERSGRRSSVTPSPSWLSNVLPGAGVRQKSKSFNADGVRKQRCVRDRGMSPVRSSDDDEVSDGSSEYRSTESCKQTPMKTAVRRGGGQKSVTELIFRPLVRASPNRISSVKGKPPVDGDIRAPAMPHLLYAKSFSANRSRKLADFGRSDPSR